MNSVWLLLSGLLSVAIGFFLAAPLFDPLVERLTGASCEESDIPRRLRDSKDRTLRALKDLELDHQMGKVNLDDFERAHQELSQELVSILQAIKNHE